ncbi:MAG: hypothetical protein D6705_04470 [Deltaproteobacteria bacterium]|nr:MAG: hypothetical protein D6705_04470 [Deltaproteobacteria bacterium]
MTCAPFLQQCDGGGMCGATWDDCTQDSDCCPGLVCDAFFGACQPA